MSWSDPCSNCGEHRADCNCGDYNGMSRSRHCQACIMLNNGVKTRIALEHTCGLEPGAMPDLEAEKRDSANHITIGGDLYKKYKQLKSIKKPKPKPPKPRY